MTVSPFSDPPSEADVAVVGAGAAGIAAARRCLAGGLTVAVVEARQRVGGRATTMLLKGHPIDLGAHWLHCGPINPLVALGQARSEPMRRAPGEGHLFVKGRRGSRGERRALDRAFAMADRALTQGAKAPRDRAAAGALPILGPWREGIATVHGLVSGRPLSEVSLQDFPSMEYADNRFIAGGLGVYVARLAKGLPIRLGTSVSEIDVSGEGVAIETTAGTLRARAVIMTVPPVLLQRGVIQFRPGLPPDTEDAIHGFMPATYEHVILHWPRAPFTGPDRLATLAGTRHRPPGMLTRIDGTPFHYFELDHPTALAAARGEGAARFARRVLREQFGNRAIADLTVAKVTSWRDDPLSAGSWSVVPPGRYAVRDLIKVPVAGKLWFAGEFGSRAQWGTAGGAWQEGEHAAGKVVRQLRSCAP